MDDHSGQSHGELKITEIELSTTQNENQALLAIKYMPNTAHDRNRKNQDHSRPRIKDSAGARYFAAGGVRLGQGAPRARTESRGC